MEASHGLALLVRIIFGGRGLKRKEYHMRKNLKKAENAGSANNKKKR
jgi:hypothetical protein